ncbi:MAG: glycosyltransferase family 2 protein [Lachnospiraceae bacterium]|nr:glycosyltransferase family 2 protein [Lachnospiraceae bacterium]
MKLTIFTPTYNRKELLKRAYESLKAQTCKDFCWLIVDDGSTDDTASAVEEWGREGIIPIEYLYFENGGKMRAHNRGVENCRTEWFLCLDSDDRLVPDAVEEILRFADSLDVSKPTGSPDTMAGGREEGILADSLDVSKPTGSPDTAVGGSIAGIIAHKGRSDTELLSGVGFPKGVERSTLYGLYLKGFKGETTLVFRTDVLRRYPFPEIEGEKYVPEDYIYDKIDAEYEYIVLDRILTVCELISEGYTDSVRRLKEDNKQAWYLYYEQRARITPMSLLKLKYLGFYRLYAGMSGHALKEADGISVWDKILGIPGEMILKLTGKI